LEKLELLGFKKIFHATDMAVSGKFSRIQTKKSKDKKDLKPRHENLFVTKQRKAPILVKKFDFLNLDGRMREPFIQI
jgi:hypothetical protein